MTTNEGKRYKEALLKKMAELSETLGDRRPIAIEFTPEACEGIVLAAQRELAVLTLDRNSRLLREVKRPWPASRTAATESARAAKRRSPRNVSMPFHGRVIACSARTASTGDRIRRRNL